MMSPLLTIAVKTEKKRIGGCGNWKKEESGKSHFQRQSTITYGGADSFYNKGIKKWQQRLWADNLFFCFWPFRKFLLRQIIVPHCHCFNSHSCSHPFPFVYNANPVCVIINVYHKSHLGGCKWMWQPITKAEPISAVHFFSFSSFHYLMTKF